MLQTHPAAWKQERNTAAGSDNHLVHFLVAVQLDHADLIWLPHVHAHRTNLDHRQRSSVRFVRGG